MKEWQFTSRSLIQVFKLYATVFMSNTAPVFSHTSRLHPWSLMLLFGWEGKYELTTLVACSCLSLATFDTSLWCHPFCENVGISHFYFPQLWGRTNWWSLLLVHTNRDMSLKIFLDSIFRSENKTERGMILLSQVISFAFTKKNRKREKKMQRLLILRSIIIYQ